MTERVNPLKEAKDERIDLLDTIEGLRADIESLCEALWKREPGCAFVRLNYPAIAARLETKADD